jgi:purine nucleosidase
VAIAVLADPEACRSVHELVIMGGAADGLGNITPAAEFNFWVDPRPPGWSFTPGCRCAWSAGTSPAATHCCASTSASA